MTEAQKWVLIAASLIVATILHVVLFDWSTEQPYGQPLFAYVFCDPMRERNCLAIWYDRAAAGSYLAATMLGIVMPICLIAFAAYLLVGIWKSK